MPIFEYNCNECEKKFEKLLKNRNPDFGGKLINLKNARLKFLKSAFVVPS